MSSREERRFHVKIIARPIKIAGQWVIASMKKLKPARAKRQRDKAPL